MFLVQYDVNNIVNYDIKEYRDIALEMYNDWKDLALEETFDGFATMDNKVTLIEIDDENVKDIVNKEKSELKSYVLKKFYTDENYNWTEEEE